MIPYLFSSILWIGLIALDLLLARKLCSMYHKDGDLRKFMFAIGLLMCTPVYALAIVGIDSFPFSRNIFDWSPLPVLMAFGYTLLCDRFKIDLQKCYKIFSVGTVFTVGLFFFSPPNISTPFLLTGLIFTIILSVDQNLKRFDLSSVTLYLSMPSFAICFVAIGFGMGELALFSGFAAKAALLLAFEISKNPGIPSSSMLVLKKQLGVAEDNFAKLFSLLPDPAVIVDSKGTFLALSPNITSISGFQIEELLGNNFLTTELITAHSKAILLKNLTKRMVGLHIDPYQIEIRAKDGRILQFELNASKIEYDGKPADMILFRDLTERNRLLEFANLLFEFAPEPYYLSDLKGNFVDGNKAAQELVGYEKQELIGKSFLNLKLLQKRQIPKAAKLLALNRLGKRTGPDEFMLNRRDGSQVSVEISTFPLKTKEQTVVLGIARDVTECKKAERAIKESEEKFRTIFEKANDGLILLEMDGRVTDLNPEGEKIFGFDRKVGMGKLYTELGLPNLIQMNVDPPKPIWHELNSVVDTTLTRSDGETKHLEVTSSIIVLNDARKNILLTVRDVTERKKMQESLISSERLAAVGRLATMVAHDLRNPLQGITTAVYFMKRTTQQSGDEKTTATLKSIDDAVKYSEKIVRDLLDYTGDKKLDITETDPHSIINQSLSGIIIPERIELIDRTQIKPKVYVDLDRIKRVIMNLVTNAFDAMPNGGTLTITSKEKNGSLELSISDTGSGIPKEKMDKLWTPFVTTKAKGMGLGLPISKRIIEEHSGQILVDSENGKGTTFTLVIPIFIPEKETLEFSVNTGQSILQKT